MIGTAKIDLCAIENCIIINFGSIIEGLRTRVV